MKKQPEDYLFDYAKELLAIALMTACAFVPDLYDSQWLVVCAFVTVLIAAKILERELFSLPVVLFASYLAFCAIFKAAYGVARPGHQFLVIFTLRQTLFIVGGFVAAYMWREQIEKILLWFVPVGIFVTMLGVPLINHNASLNAALLVALLPFAIMQREICVLIAGFLVVFNQSSVALLMYVVLLGLLYWRDWLSLSWKWRLFTLPALGVPVLGRIAIRGWSLPALKNLFTDSQRLEFYGYVWRFFEGVFRLPADAPNQMKGLLHTYEMSDVVGSGLGTFVMYGPIIQRLAQFGGKELWVSLHSDWFQLLFETGFLGFVLGLAAYVNTIIRSDEKGRIALILLGICAVVYFPMQAPIMAFMCLWLVARAQ